MSRRLQQYRRRFGHIDTAVAAESAINDSHRSAVGTGRTQRHVRDESGNLKALAGVNKITCCSLPIKPEKAARLAAALPRRRS